MGKEIERKFLVITDKWNQMSATAYTDITVVAIKQGYLFTSRETTVRIRIADDKGFITIKGKTKNLSRPEFEYEIPVVDAEELIMDFCNDVIIKKRYYINFTGNNWEVDEFLGENEGLILAEIELDNENQKVELPEWIGKEVSRDKRYFNSFLVKNPFKSWKKTASELK